MFDRHFAEKDRAKAMRCAEEGVVRARSLDQPNRTTEIVAWGETVARPWQQGRGQEAHRRGRRHVRPLESQQPIRRDVGEIAASDRPLRRSPGHRPVEENLERILSAVLSVAQVAVALEDIKQVETLLKDADPQTIKKRPHAMGLSHRSDAARRGVRAVEASDGKQATAEDMTACLARLAELIGTHDRRSGAFVDRPEHEGHVAGQASHR